MTRRIEHGDVQAAGRTGRRLLALPASHAGAQGYPNKPIKLVMPYSPGGATRLHRPHDRAISRRDHRAAGGGGEPARRRRHRRHRLLSRARRPTATRSSSWTRRSSSIRPCSRACHIDLFKQLAAVSFVSSSPEVLVVAPQSAGEDVWPSSLAYGKANPGKMNFASAGIGTTPHLAARTVPAAHRRRRRRTCPIAASASPIPT